MNGDDRVRFVRLVDRFSQEQAHAEDQVRRRGDTQESLIWGAVAGVWAAAGALLRDELGPQEVGPDTSTFGEQPRPSRAPTTCDFMLKVRSTITGQEHAVECGESIRWSQVNGWYHVMDARLGDVGHPATPPIGYGR